MSKPKLAELVCSECGAVGKFKKIIYGMPSDDFDFEKYAVGGCIAEDDAPDISCGDCSAETYLKEPS